MTTRAAPTDLVDLRGKTALVTGGAKRIGAAVSEALAAQGVQVVVHYNTAAAEAEALADSINAGGVRAWALGGDLSVAAAAPALFDLAVEAAGPIDFLVNSASVFPAHALGEVSAKDVHEAVDVNALSPFMLARALAAQAASGCRGQHARHDDYGLRPQARGVPPEQAHVVFVDAHDGGRVCTVGACQCGGARAGATARRRGRGLPGTARLEQSAQPPWPHGRCGPRPWCSYCATVSSRARLSLWTAADTCEGRCMADQWVDKIHIRDLRVRCIVGVFPEERDAKQDVIINITLYADCRPAGRSDAP